jgi:hypothetical protein
VGLAGLSRNVESTYPQRITGRELRLWLWLWLPTTATTTATTQPPPCTSTTTTSTIPPQAVGIASVPYGHVWHPPYLLRRRPLPLPPLLTTLTHCSAPHGHCYAVPAFHARVPTLPHTIPLSFASLGTVCTCANTHQTHGPAPSAPPAARVSRAPTCCASTSRRRASRAAVVTGMRPHP